MKKQLLIAILAIFFITQGWAQTERLWSPLTKERAEKLGEVNPLHIDTNGKFFQFDAQQLKPFLAAVNDNPSSEGIVVAIPSVNGKTERFRIVEYSNFDADLQAQYPNIRAYAGQGIDDATARINFSLSPTKGISVMIMRADRQVEFIEPFNKNGTAYVIYNRSLKASKGKVPFTCFTPEEHELASELNTQRGAMANNQVLKTFRLAISTTGEYTLYHGGVTQALEAINTTMTRVNGVYARDIAVRLQLIAGTTAVVYPNPATDPYADPDVGMDNEVWNSQVQSTLSTNIGNFNYDIGHLFAGSGGGGNAGCIGCVCQSGKGSAYTAPSTGQPEGDLYDIDYVAHEMGHQLGGTHTMTASVENAGVSVEPGSGSTIMGYAGIVDGLNVQNFTDAYFHTSSIQQIQINLLTKTCAVNTPINNPPMTINAGADYVIPRGTAFVLRAVNAGTNAGTVTYCWEQTDNPTSAAAVGGNSITYANKPNGPTFRSYTPTASPDRYMPKLEKVLAGTLTADWETVSNVARNLNFTLTGRDNVATGGQTKTDGMVATVTTAAGPFVVTSQNAQGINYTVGSAQTVTWNVAGTTANGVNTAQVNIKMSIDGGQTFPYVLAANTPNDGSQPVTLPAGVTAPFCRIMVEAVGNIFYAVNSAPFAIGYIVTNTCNTFTNNTVTAIPDGGTGLSGSVINIPTNATISDLNVALNVTHTYVSDLVFVLQSPAGVQRELWVRQCGDRDNLNVTFDDSGFDASCTSPITGTIRPQQALSVYNGTSQQGQWILGFLDVATPDAGTLNSWSLQICSQQVTAGSNEFGLQDFRLYPNPNSGSFTVEFNSESANEIQIVVHDMRGRQIMSKSYENSGMFSGNINLGHVETGVYMVTVNDGNRKEVKRIVVQ